VSDFKDRVSEIQADWGRERPELDVSPMGVIGRLHRLGGFLREELVSVYAEYGLGEGDFDVLATLRRAGSPFERAPKDLARNTMVTTGAMTKRIDRLESAGLVARRASDVDGRGRVVALTARGLETIDSAFAHHMDNERRLLATLTPREAAQLEALLAKWLGGFERGPADRRGAAG
jgi:DNA-binding MarR family transcriptional regulator